MELRNIVLDTKVFWDLLQGKIHIEPYYEILIPATMISDILYIAYLMDKDLNHLWDKLRKLDYISIDSNLSFEQFVLKMELDENKKKIRDNSLNVFALASKTESRIFCSKRNHLLFEDFQKINSIGIK